MKKKNTTRIIAIVLCVVTVFGIIAGAIAGSSNSSTDANTATLLDVLGPKKRITDEQLSNVVTKNKGKDYSLKTVLDILGNPGAIMAAFDGTTAYNYAIDADIKQILENYQNVENYSKDSVIQLMWLTENEDLVFTYIAADYNTPTVIGMSKQSLKTVEKGAKYIPTTEHALTDFNEYTKETLKNFENAFMSTIQYPLLECYFTKKNISSSDYSAEWTTKVVQNKTGLIYMLLKNGEPYQMYQDYDSNKIKTYDKSTKLWTGLNERQFLNIYPEAMRIQLFNYEENDTMHFIISYAVKEKDSNGKVTETVYNIVDNDLYVYDDKGNLVENEGGLVIEKPNSSSNNTETTEPSTTTPTETTTPTNP